MLALFTRRSVSVLNRNIRYRMASSLASPVKELVQAAYNDPPSSGPVAEWITKVSQGEVVKEANLKVLGYVDRIL